MRSFCWVAAALTIVACSPNLASADTIYASEVLFVAAAGPLGIEGFEGLTATNSSIAPLNAALAAFLLTASPQAGVYDQVDYAGTHKIDGKNYVEVEDPPAYGQLVMTFTFPSPITAFGLWITDFGDNFTSTLSYLTNSAVPASGQVAPTGGANGNDLFFGIVATGNPFSTFTLSTTAAGSDPRGDPFSVDKVQYSVPDPGATVVLFGLALGALAGVRRLG